MRVQLFAVRIGEPADGDTMKALLRAVPPERRRRLERVRDPLRCTETACAYALLFKGLNRLYAWSAPVPMERTERGKPFFPAHPEIHFSISHTRGAALVGIYDRPIGVDLEKIRPVSDRMLHRFPGTATEREFYAQWTRYESAVKQSGEGLAALRQQEALTGRFFFPLEPFPGYTACVCTETEEEPALLRCFSVEELL